MDRNTEIEQYFALWNESFPVAATHDHWVRWGKLLRVWLPSIDGVPMNVEVTGDFPRALKKWTSLVSRQLLQSHDVNERGGKSEARQRLSERKQSASPEGEAREIGQKK